LVWPRQTGAWAPLGKEEAAGPFAPLVEALAGLPAGRRLRVAIDEAFGPTTLGARPRALVFAVVARGLGCSLAAAEAERLLLAEGMTADEIAHVLAHLSGPMLDATDRAAIGLARESIWYRPAQIQRYARTIRPQLSREQFVELVGYAGLANMLGRLGIVTELA
jgi:alkylhydroperoxidase family enzyme